jgi:hypothetical protein
MISKELFIKMITTAEKYDAELWRWQNFGIDVFEQPIACLPWDMFTIWMEGYFDSDGIDWINWYLWERVDVLTDEISLCYDEDGKPFSVKDAADLWDLVAPHRKKPCADAPCNLLQQLSCTNS